MKKSLLLTVVIISICITFIFAVSLSSQYFKKHFSPKPVIHNAQIKPQHAIVKASSTTINNAKLNLFKLQFGNTYSSQEIWYPNSQAKTESTTLQDIDRLETLPQTMIDSHSNNNTPLPKEPEAEIIFLSDNIRNTLISCTAHYDIETNFDCKTVLDSSLSEPEDLLILENHLFVANMASNDITHCNIDTFGLLANCHNQKIPLNNPVHFYYDTQQLFISDFSSKHIIACELTNDFELTHCNNSDNILAQFFTTSNSKGYSYTPNYAKHAINKCINLYNSDCETLTNPALILPLTVSATKQHLYISNAIDDIHYNVLRCELNNTNQLNNCLSVSNKLMLPIGIAVFEQNSTNHHL